MRPLLLNVAELLRRPGTEREVSSELSADELGIDDPRVDPSTPVTIAVTLESLTDGVTVLGRISTAWHDSCRRCLVPLAGDAVVPVDELYQSHLTSDEAFPIHADQLDLAPMARELVMLELPVAPLCRDDCAGLCATCGANRNDTPCACEQPVADDRWSALDALRQQLN